MRSRAKTCSGKKSTEWVLKKIHHIGEGKELDDEDRNDLDREVDDEDYEEVDDKLDGEDYGWNHLTRVGFGWCLVIQCQNPLCCQIANNGCRNLKRI